MAPNDAALLTLTAGLVVCLATIVGIRTSVLIRERRTTQAWTDYFHAAVADRVRSGALPVEVGCFPHVLRVAVPGQVSAQPRVARPSPTASASGRGSRSRP